MRQRDAKHTLRKSPFVRRTTPRSSGTVACWPTRVLLLCLYLVVFYYAFPKNARPSPYRLGFFRRFFRQGAKSRGKQNIRSDVPLFSGTPDWSRTSGLTLRSRFCEVCTACHLWPQTLAISHFFQALPLTICHCFLLISIAF